MASFIRNFRPAQQVAQVPASAVQPIRIVSWNILADKYSRANLYCPQEYLDWEYRWPLIRQQLKSYNPDLLCLQEVQEDVFLQQLEPWLRSRGYSSLYSPRPQAPGSTIVGPMDGVSLHFKDSMFSHQASQQVKLADYAQQLLPSSCCSKHTPSQQPVQQQKATRSRSPQRQKQQQQQQQQLYYPFMQTLQQRQEGAVMALLLHKPSQQQLVACSTHLHWNPAFPDVKLAQAAILSHTIASFIEQQQQQEQAALQGLPAGQQQQQQQQQRQQPPPQAGASRRQQQEEQPASSLLNSMPVIVGGDFNSTWRKVRDDLWDKGVCEQGHITSGVYELMSGQYVGPTHRDHPANRQLCQDCSHLQQQESQVLLGHTFTTAGLQLESSQFSVYGREPALTTRTSTFSGCLDYIWLSKQHWRVQSTLELPYKEPKLPARHAEVDLEWCPNSVQPSDHLAMGCEALLLPAVAVAGVKQQEVSLAL